MSDALIVRRGGSGGLSPNSAVIHVVSEAGSTITFTKGGMIIKVLDASKSHINAISSDVADWYYSVGFSNYGAWTVTASLNGRSKSKTITIDSNKQYDVMLDYPIFILKNGIVQSGYSLGTYNLGSFTITQEDGDLYYSAGTGSGNGSIYVEQTLDFDALVASGYSKAVMDVMPVENSAAPYLRVGTSTAYDEYLASVQIAQPSIQSASVRYTKELDITDAYGDLYVKYAVGRSGARGVKVKFYNIWLE